MTSHPQPLSKIQLIPVVEIVPDGDGFLRLEGSIQENPNGWASYWATSVAWMRILW